MEKWSVVSGQWSARRARGFSLFELTMVLFIVAIIAAIILPAVGNNLRSSRLATAANVLASDIEYCSSECITRPSTPRAIVFDTTLNKYTLQDLNSGVAITHPGDSKTFVNDFSTGRNAQLSGVTLRSVLQGNSAITLLTFDAYGRPVITQDMTIQLGYNGQTMTLTVKKGTGDVSIVSP